jgi:hypothetical protein
MTRTAAALAFWAVIGSALLITADKAARNITDYMTEASQ